MNVVFILALLAVVCTVFVIGSKVKRGNAAPLGWMSAQWIAEHRAGHQ